MRHDPDLYAMDPLRVLILDDERLARQEMRALLGAHRDVEVIGEVASVAEARQSLARNRPDVVFLDIQLAGESGFDLMPDLADCSVVFVTAFDTYAVRAFEFAARDYLLKPVVPKRLEQAITRLRAGGRAAQAIHALTMEDWLFAQIGTEHGFVKVADIRCILAEGDYSRLWLDNGRSSLLLRSLREWESRLPAAQFLRVHRSVIVNLAHVGQISGDLRMGYLARVEGLPRPVPISRRYASRVRARLR
jgi:two-component system LytT family response regulator